MLTTLVFICFCLATISHAEIIINSANSISSSPSPSPFDIEKELDKINSTCFLPKEYELLTGNYLKDFSARNVARALLETSAKSIGLSELRRSLNFGPLRPRKRYNSTRPSEEELASATSIEEYYNMFEPIPIDLSLDDKYNYERNIVIAIEYLDKRLPSFRTIYRRRFEEMHRLNNGLIDRESINRMVEEWVMIWIKIETAIQQLTYNSLRSLVKSPPTCEQ